MSKTINTAVTAIVANAVPTNYRFTAGVSEAQARIVTDVETLANETADALRLIGAENGLSADLVEQALIQVGLADAPEPIVEAEPETLEQKIDRLLATQESQATDIARLLTVAREQGLLRG